MADSELRIVIAAQIEQAKEALDSLAENAIKMAESFKGSGDISTEAIDGVRFAVEELKTDLQGVRDKVIDVVLADGDAKAKIDELKAKMDSIPPEKTIFINVEQSGQPPGGGGAGEAGGMLGLLAFLPMLTPIVDVLTGSLMGMAGSFTAAASGAVAFGAVAGPSLKDVLTAAGQVYQAQLQLNSAMTPSQYTSALQAMRTAYAGLDAGQVRAVRQVLAFQHAYEQFADAFQPQVLRIFTDALQTAMKLLQSAQPLITAAGNAIEGLFQSMDKAAGGSGVKSVFQWLASEAGPALSAFGQGMGNLLGGWFALMKDFTPEIKTMNDWWIKATASFETWASQLGKTQGFKDFLRYVNQEGPQVSALFDNLVSLAVQLLQAMAPLGAIILRVVNDLLRFAVAHPIIARVLGVLLPLVGAFKLLSAPIREAGAALKALMVFFGLMEGEEGALTAATLAAAVAQKAQALATGIATEAQTAFDIVMDANPIVLVMLAIAALLPLILLLVTHWKQVTVFLGTAWAAIVATAGRIWTGLVAFFENLFAPVVTRFESVWNTVKTALEAAWNSLAATADKVWKGIVSFLEAVWTPVAAAYSKEWRMIGDSLHNSWQTIKSDAESVWRAIAGSIESIVQGSVQSVESLVHGLVQDVENAWNSVKSIVNSIKGATSAIGTAISNGMNTITQDIPKLASGGIVNSPTLALIGEAGPEMVVPLSKTPVNPGAVGPLPSPRGGGGIGGTQINVYVTGNVAENESALADLVATTLMQRMRMQGQLSV